VCAVLAPLRRMRSPGAQDERSTVQVLPSQSRPAGPAEAVPAVRQAGLFAGRDRVVRILFTTWPAKRPAQNLRGLRRTAAPRGTRHVFEVLAGPPGPPLRAG